jgi:hypothetical protein
MTFAAVSVPVTVAGGGGQAGGVGTVAGALPRFVHRNITIPPLIAGLPK